jgi:hypothetical protein
VQNCTKVQILTQEALRQELGFPLLIPLPDLYHDLYMTYRDYKCRSCQLVPHRPALCLICGELVCFASDCCAQSSSGGGGGHGLGGGAGEQLFECFSHADKCHAGTGTYVILKSSMVLVIREMHWCSVRLLYFAFLVLLALLSHREMHWCSVRLLY